MSSSRLEQEPEAGANDRVVVDDENANRHGSGTVPRQVGRVPGERARRRRRYRPRRVAVAATVRAADQRGSEPQDHLPHPEAVGDRADPRVMPLRAQLGQEVRQPRLELDDAVVLHPPARSIERRLRVVAVVHDPADDLEVALGLHRPTHHPERPEKLASLEQHARG